MVLSADMSEHKVADRIHSHHHAVQFYGDESELFETTGTFLSEGLVSGQPALVIATPEHSAAIQDSLGSHLIDVARARHLGDLVMLDAEETLGTFMHGGMPDEVLFQPHVGDLIEQTLRGRGRAPLRVYSEMVDVLWRRGQADTAIRLEVLWNGLATTHTFALLCGYAIANVCSDMAKIEDVCEQHSHVLGTNVLPIDVARSIRALA